MLHGYCNDIGRAMNFELHDAAAQVFFKHVFAAVDKLDVIGIRTTLQTALVWQVRIL